VKFNRISIVPATRSVRVGLLSRNWLLEAPFEFIKILAQADDDFKRDPEKFPTSFLIPREIAKRLGEIMDSSNSNMRRFPGAYLRPDRFKVSDFLKSDDGKWILENFLERDEKTGAYRIKNEIDSEAENEA